MSPKFGASFSYKYALEMGVNPKQCLNAALIDLGVKRLRLMSYWDLHEPNIGVYDFAELDWQIKVATKYGAEVTLSLGLRQPRWPESHWPAWAKELSTEEWQDALCMYIKAVVNRYKKYKCIVSYQLENEALLKTFGQDGDFDRKRLMRELNLVKNLDSSRPVIMSTSDSYGIPFFGPHPDVYAFSLYRYFYDRGQYRQSKRPPSFYKVRAWLIRLLTGRKVFIHEFQAEPWGPVGTAEMPLEEHFKSIDRIRVQEAVKFALKSKLLPADMWGLEWWYWLKVKQNKPEIWNDMRKVYNHK
jgi:hypothetical protein